jgi:hypothetical protein
LAVQAVLTLLAAVGGIFVGLRLAPRGTDIAGDLHDLQNRLAADAMANATLAEMHKAEDGQEDWRKREWANLRRIKLEALLIKVHDCEHFVNPLRDAALKNPQQRDPLSELDVITTLYFPELKVDVDAYLQQCRTKRSAVSEAQSSVGKSNGVANVPSDVKRADFEAARDRLSTSARNLTTEIMGVGQ